MKSGSANRSTGITFHEYGIAHVLAEHQLAVPVNQRPYAWTEEEINRLLQDLTKAFDESAHIYFLGTVVLTRSERHQWEVADGQQRLATTAILIAAIRDYLIELGDEKGAQKYESDYLIEYDPRTREHHAKLELNTEDNDFFIKTILLRTEEHEANKKQRFTSHQRLSDAAALISEHIRKLTAALADDEKATRLYDFVDFLDQSAVVIVINVPGDVGNAFTMFETLNARGLRASQVDILKNYLFEKSGLRVRDLRARWTSMLTTIENYGEDDLLISFIRHYWISEYGPTTEKELGDQIRSKVKGERQAIDLVSALESNASDYVALLLPKEHPRWATLSRDTTNSIHTITRELGAEQILPLMLAVVRKFEEKEAERAFKLFLSWTVRLLIVGGAGGGQIERQYGLRAAEVSSGEVRTAKQLAEKMLGFIPNDESFRSSFAVASVRRAHLARYYLRALELHQKGELLPQLLPSEDTTAVNLEHILPINPGDNWSVSSDVAQALYKRLGNMVLLLAKENAKIGNLPFDDKKRTFKQSPFVLTSDVARFRAWGPKQIDERQAYLAEMAPLVWPV